MTPLDATPPFGSLSVADVAPASSIIVCSDASACISLVAKTVKDLGIVITPVASGEMGANCDDSTVAVILAGDDLESSRAAITTLRQHAPEAPIPILIVAPIALQGEWYNESMSHDFIALVDPVHQEKSLRQWISMCREVQRLRIKAGTHAILHAELKRSNVALEEFAHIASHDLQEPLRGITTYFQLLYERYRNTLDGRGQGYMDRILSTIEQAREVLQGTLEFSGITNRPPRYEQIDANAVVAALLVSMEPKIQLAKATVTVDSLPIVWMDRIQFSRVMQNLLSNALKFTAITQPIIAISAVENEREWVFSIADNGIGIAPEHRHEIFAPFKRIAESEHYPGTGLGLAICRKIVEFHGGRIWISETPGGGATFSFTVMKRH